MRPVDRRTRARALALLAEGHWTPGDIAEVAGVSRQVICNWARRAGVDYQRVRRAQLVKEWTRVELLDLGLNGALMPKRRLRRMGQKAKARWDTARRT